MYLKSTSNKEKKKQNFYCWYYLQEVLVLGIK
jgi:hypothetical protein